MVHLVGQQLKSGGHKPVRCASSVRRPFTVPYPSARCPSAVRPASGVRPPSVRRPVSAVHHSSAVRPPTASSLPSVCWRPSARCLSAVRPTVRSLSLSMYIYIYVHMYMSIGFAPATDKKYGLRMHYVCGRKPLYPDLPSPPIHPHSKSTRGGT